MSDIKYGLISRTDADTLEKTIDLIIGEFDDVTIHITEIGVYGGATGRGIVEYVMNKWERNIFITGIDNNKDGEKIKFKHLYDKIIDGNSTEVYNQLEDNSQHLIFQDACHCFSCVISSFYCYADKVKVGGYLAFHDTGRHIKPFKDFQHGDKNNPDAYISARKALNRISLLFDNDIVIGEIIKNHALGQWELIFDEADSSDLAGGICVFKKLY